MPDRPRVFVSSIMEGYTEFRDAARSGIEKAGGRPVLIEDQPARPDAPRNACLDLVATSDAALFVIGPRGGYRAPSGKPVVREEFDEAQARNLPSIVLLQDVERDPDGEQLAQGLSDWVGGRLRRTFATPAELEAEVREALSPILDSMSRPDRDPNSLQNLVADTSHGGGQYDTVLRLVFAPKVESELIDPLLLDSPNLQDSVQRAAHGADFFSYEIAKETRPTSEQLQIIQGADSRERYAEIVLRVSGEVILASTVRSRGNDDAFFAGGSMARMFEIVKSDLEQIITGAFTLLGKLLSEIDEHQRYVSWIYNAALLDPQMKRIVDTPAPKGSGHQAGIYNPDLVTAYQRPREINRSRISQPEPEVHRIATLLQKRLEEARSL